MKTKFTVIQDLKSSFSFLFRFCIVEDKLRSNGFKEYISPKKCSVLNPTSTSFHPKLAMYLLSERFGKLRVIIVTT